MLKYLIGCALLMSSAAHADEFSDAFSQCAVTKSDQQRLKCYDGLRENPVKSISAEKSNPSEYPNIDINDLKVDFSNLNGKKFSVAAYVQSFGGVYFMKSESMDTSPISLDINKLPRDDRKKIISDCQTKTCLGVFYGVVDKGAYESKFIVRKVQWDSK